MVNKNSFEKRYYFDWAASAPILCEYLSYPYGNPSSLHSEGRQAKLALEDARQRCASVLNVPAGSLFFTGSGTEANSIVMFSSLTRPGRGKTLYSLAEHSSVREAAETLEKMGKPCASITVDADSRVTPADMEKALEKNSDARFAFCMSVNNETGAVTDIKSLGEIIRKQTKPPLHLHCDLVQAVGKIPVDINAMGIDSAAISAHKIGGPRGIGLLYLKTPKNFESFYKGGGQERGIRGGTENVQGALALADCLEMFAGVKTVQENYNSAKNRWKKLISALCEMPRFGAIPAARDEDSDNFSPYIIQAAFKDIPGEVMARALDDLGFAVSTGSACSSSSPERPVLQAMGVPENLRLEGIRISQGVTTTDEDIDALIKAIAEVLSFL